MICCGIYAITNKTNGKKYIGMSTHILKRWGEHIQSSTEPNNSLYNSPLYKAFRKYGIESFSFEILELCDQKEMTEKEIYWIDFYDAFRTGYNCTIGGEGYTVIDASPIIEMWNNGKSIKEIGDALHIGYKTIQKAISNINSYTTKEAKRRGNGKKIDMYSLNGEYIKTFTSIAEAADEVHCDRCCITRAAQCHKGNSVVRGYIFQYHGDEPPLIKYGHRSKINQYDLNGHYIATHNSIAEAARTLNISMAGIASCFHKHSKSSGGFMFRYFDGENTQDIKPYKDSLRKRGTEVSQYTTDNKLLNTYRNATDACAKTGIKNSHITACCRGEQNTAGGYIWKYTSTSAS